MRRPVAIVTALVLFGEAVGIVIVNAVLATVAENQNMSLAGMDPRAMSAGTWVMGGVSGLLLVLCGLTALIAGVRDRAPGRVGRIVLIGCAVVHGVLGAVTVGLVGWAAFAFMMVVLALLVLTLLSYGPGARAEEAVGGDRGDKAAPAAV
ncbi:MULTISPECIES: hypothetical protein [Streptomyces]|uniref:hypothetical protein n=1 Tax=Streptomyces TaxID=1883 RepID=UPI0004C91919|nr:MULTISPECIES: hypothetical protein [Streptomyces]MDX2920825.1 hypothetical protein [Streptomyces sp. NE06-03C]MDX3609222.1 hypothetical protein [Streptomyces sp. FL06-04B]MDX3734710.1 hypothetical protein [Streptomyces sp. ID01-15D]